MNKKFNLKDTVWIHIGERTLTQGRVVEIIDLEHLDEGHSPDDELYIIEIKTDLDNTYEIRSWKQISPDAQGPINIFRIEDHTSNNRALKKFGMPLPEGAMEFEHDEPTPEQIHAAMERSQLAVQHDPLSLEKKPKRKYYNRRPKKS
jgi:hypothetical protein